jgi:biotin transport system substrate-specific component
MNTKTKTQSVVLIALFAALIAVGAFVKIPLPTPMPITMQSAFVLLAAFVLGPVNGAASVAVYLVLGLAGLPVFIKGGGIGYIFEPTFGFLIGFVLAAVTSGVSLKFFKKRTLLAYTLAGLIGIVSYYLIGLPYMHVICKYYLHAPMAAKTLFISCFLVFLPGDILTMMIAGAACLRLPKTPTQNKKAGKNQTYTSTLQ